MADLPNTSADPCRETLIAILPALRVLRTMMHRARFHDGAAKAEEMIAWANEAIHCDRVPR